MSHDVDLAGAAALLQRSYGYLQKHWRRLAREEGFPAPFVGGEVGSRPWWVAEAIEAWKRERSGLSPAPRTTANPAQLHDAGTARAAPIANDPTPRAIAPRDRAARLIAAAGGQA